MRWQMRKSGHRKREICTERVAELMRCFAQVTPEDILTRMHSNNNILIYCA